MTGVISPLKWLPEDFNPSNAVGFSRPFYTFILKLASRCNLNCSYCYVYQSPDQSWKSKPTFLARDTAQKVAERIAEHVRQHSLEEVSIVYHGGEPLLAGVDRLKEYTEILTSTVPCPISFAMQTNGVLIDESISDLLVRHRFRVGISLDGSREHNDRHRVDHAGRSSYEDTIKGIRFFQARAAAEGVFGGVLIVVDLKNSPRDVLSAIDGLGIRSANLLLPDCNYDSPPPRPAGDETAYGRWLFEFFRALYTDYPHIEVPYLEEIINLMLGGQSTSEEIGAESVDFVIVDTNGDIEPVDTLKMVGREATFLGLNVFTHSFDDALRHPAIFARMAGFGALCKTCRDCEFVGNCGGGYIPHRYSSARGFINPSVYCHDLQFLFTAMREFLSRA